MDLWALLIEYSDAINTIVNFLILVVWASYFQLLLSTHWQQRQAKILINRGAGHEITANCLISNMSAEPIYVDSIVVIIDPDGQPIQRSLTDLNSLSKKPGSDARSSWFQGPVAKGDYINIGTFESLLQQALVGDSGVGTVESDSRDLPSDTPTRDQSLDKSQEHTVPTDAPLSSREQPDQRPESDTPDRQSEDTIMSVDQISAFDIMVIAIYGPEEYPVAAKRCFRFNPDKTRGSRWRASDSRQISKRSERRRLKQVMNEIT